MSFLRRFEAMGSDWGWVGVVGRLEQYVGRKARLS